jgi:hypothetical protein
VTRITDEARAWVERAHDLTDDELARELFLRQVGYTPLGGEPDDSPEVHQGSGEEP